MIRFACPRCHAVHKVSDERAGVAVKCSSCGHKMRVPVPAETVLTATSLPDDEDQEGIGIPESSHEEPPPRRNRLVGIEACPGCRAPLQVPPEMVNRWLNCPKCGMGFSATPLEPSQSQAHHSPVYDRAPTYQEALYAQQYTNSNRVAAGVFAILLGPLGIHKFILGFPVAEVLSIVVDEESIRRRPLS